MGLQPISDRKLRQVAQATGLPLLHAMRHSNHLWFAWVAKDNGHWHIELDPASGRWEYSGDHCGFSSCHNEHWGPRVLPEQRVLLDHLALLEERERQRELRDEEAAATMERWRTHTLAWLEGKRDP